MDPSAGRLRDSALRKAALRLLIGLAVIALLLWRADVPAVLDAIGRADVADVVLAFLAALVAVAVGAFRWRPFLEELDLGLPVGTALRLSFIGTFFNAFLPTGFGGDAYKAVRLRPRDRSLSRPAASVLLDRWAGLVGIAVLGSLGAAIRLTAGDRADPIVLGLVAGLGVATASGLALTVGSRLVQRTREADPAGPQGPGARLALLFRAIVLTGRHPRAAGLGLSAGLISAVFVLLAHVLLAHSLSLGVPVGALAAVMLLATLITVIPVTVNGLGLREATYVWALRSYGVGHDAALAFALLALGVVLASSLAGGIVYLVAGGDVRRRHHV